MVRPFPGHVSPLMNTTIDSQTTPDPILGPAQGNYLFSCFLSFQISHSDWSPHIRYTNDNQCKLTIFLLLRGLRDSVRPGFSPCNFIKLYDIDRLAFRKACYIGISFPLRFSSFTWIGCYLESLRYYHHGNNLA